MCLLIKTLPEPDLRYFSKLNAVCLFEKAKWAINLTGSLFLVAGTCPFLCRSRREIRSSVHPIYGRLLLHLKT